MRVPVAVIWRTAIIGSLALIALLALPAVAASQQIAYLDPGTGAVLLQSLLALFMGLMVAIGVWWTRFKGFVGKLFGRGSVGEDDE